MNSVVMSIRGLPSSELWVPTLPVVPVSSGRNQMVPGGSGGSGGSGDSEIVGFDWSYQSRIRKWYFVTSISMRRARAATAVVPDVSKIFLDTPGVA